MSDLAKMSRKSRSVSYLVVASANALAIRAKWVSLARGDDDGLGGILQVEWWSTRLSASTRVLSADDYLSPQVQAPSFVDEEPLHTICCLFQILSTIPNRPLSQAKSTLWAPLVRLRSATGFPWDPPLA